MNMNQKIIGLVTTLTLIGSLAACSTPKAESQQTTPNVTAESTTQPDTMQQGETMKDDDGAMQQGETMKDDDGAMQQGETMKDDDGAMQQGGTMKDDGGAMKK